MGEGRAVPTTLVLTLTGFVIITQVLLVVLGVPYPWTHLDVHRREAALRGPSRSADVRVL